LFVRGQKAVILAREDSGVVRLRDGSLIFTESSPHFFMLFWTTSRTSGNRQT